MGLYRFALDAVRSGKTIQVYEPEVSVVLTLSDAVNQVLKRAETDTCSRQTAVLALRNLTNAAYKRSDIDLAAIAKSSELGLLEIDLTEARAAAALSQDHAKLTRASVETGHSYAELASIKERLGEDNTRSLLSSFILLDPAFRQANTASISFTLSYKQHIEDIVNNVMTVQGFDYNEVALQRARKTIPLSRETFDSFGWTLEQLKRFAPAGNWPVKELAEEVRKSGMPEVSQEFYIAEFQQLRFERITESRTLFRNVESNPDVYPYIDALPRMRGKRKLKK